jgi:hypothetical protein
VPEPSGLVRSRTHPGVLWTHGDSGNPAELFAVSERGRLLGRVDVRGAGAADWEDLAADDAGHLWIADTGNNSNTRRDLVVYRVPEPDPKDGGVDVDSTVRYAYPDQDGFPPPARSFDAEALFWADGTLWLLTKHRDDLRTTLYRFPATEGRVVLERIEDFEVGGDPDRHGGRVTGADLDPSGRRLAVLTYHAIFVFERPDDGRHWLSRPLRRIDLDQDVTDQCEGIAWDGDALLVANEDRALFRVVDPLHSARFP